MTTDAFIELVRKRHSCRAYDPRKPVPRELILRCLEAGRMAPSACNRQPWQFVVADNPDTVRELTNQCRLPGLPHPWWADVPVFIALCAKLDLITHRIAPAISRIPYYLIDLGIAGEHVVLAAESAGLGTCWIGWFRESAVKTVLHIPRSIRVCALLTLGYPRDAAAPRAATSRNALDDIVAWNDWRDSQHPER